MCAIGGWDGSSVVQSVEWYDPDRALWSPGPSLTQPRKRLSVVTHEGRVYAIGGHDGKSALSTVEVYSQTTREWSQLPNMSQARMFAACVALGDRLYVIGGQSRLGVALDTAEVLDLQLGRWEEIPRVGSKLWSPAAITHNSSVYVFGRGSRALYNIFIYSPASKAWETVHTTLPYHMYAEVVNCAGAIYILNGSNSTRCKREGVPSIYRYDLEAHQWSGVKWELPNARAGFSVTVLNNHIAVIGGHRGREKLASVDLYDPIKGVWQSLPDMTS